LGTALHCLAGWTKSGIKQQGTTTKNQIDIWNKTQNGNLELIFENYSREKFDVIISNAAHGVVFDRNEDIVLLPLIEGALGDEYGLSVAKSISVWENFYLIASSPLKISLQVVKDKVSRSDAWFDGFSITLSPDCMASNFENGMVLHSCETEQTMSGSGFLVIEEGQLKFAGVHTGSFDRDEVYRPEACGTKTVGAVNRGVLHPQTRPVDFVLDD